MCAFDRAGTERAGVCYSTVLHTTAARATAQRSNEAVGRSTGAEPPSCQQGNMNAERIDRDYGHTPYLLLFVQRCYGTTTKKIIPHDIERSRCHIYSSSGAKFFYSRKTRYSPFRDIYPIRTAVQQPHVQHVQLTAAEPNPFSLTLDCLRYQEGQAAPRSIAVDLLRQQHRQRKKQAWPEELFSNNDKLSPLHGDPGG